MLDSVIKAILAQLVLKRSCIL